MTNVYFCLNDYQLICRVIDHMSGFSNIHISGISTTIHENVELFHDVDVLVVQFKDDYTNLVQLLSNVTMNVDLKKMQILMLFKELDMDIIHLLLQYEIKSFLLEPYDMDQLVDTIHQEGNRKEMNIVSNWNMDSIASKTMLELGLPAHLDGFQYIKTCALLVSKGFPGRRLIIGKIYEECAKLHSVTAIRVEKCIRTSINFAFRTQPESICVYNDKPTNSQIILYISEKLKLYMIM